MKKQIEGTILVIITFFVTLILNAGIDYFSTNNGKIFVSPPITKDKTIYLPVTIINYSSQVIDKVRFIVPQKTDTSKIESSYPIDIKDSNVKSTLTQTKKVSFGGIEPESAISILLPLEKYEQFEQVKAMNTSELKMVYSTFLQNENPIFASIISGFRTAFIYAIFFSISLYVISKQSSNMKESIKKTNEDLLEETKNLTSKIEQKQIEIGELQKETNSRVKEAYNSAHKMNLLFISRINDYSKELDFWRNTVRKILYSSIDSNNKSELLIRTVSENLKTYSTLKQDLTHTFESAYILSDLITNNKSK